jgi:hypothetical protein
MQTCEQQLVQPRLSSFVSDHLEHIYNSIGKIFLMKNFNFFFFLISGGAHVYRPSTSYTQSVSIQQEKISQSTVPIKKEPNKNPQTSNSVKQKIIPKKKPITIQTNPIKEEKKTRILSPLNSPNELVDISPSPPSIDNERPIASLSPSPPPPIVRIASPLTEKSRKTKRLQDHNDEKKKKIKTNIHDEKCIRIFML